MHRFYAPGFIPQSYSFYRGVDKTAAAKSARRRVAPTGGGRSVFCQSCGAEVMIMLIEALFIEDLYAAI